MEEQENPPPEEDERERQVLRGVDLVRMLIDRQRQNEEEHHFVEFVAQQLQEWNVTHDELFGIVSMVHREYNQGILSHNCPLSQPVIMRCMVSHMDFDTVKNLRLTCKKMMTMVEPYFYKRGTFKIKDSEEFYRFIKRINTNNDLIPTKMKRIEFTGSIDLFEVSRIIYRARANLKELTVITTPPTLRGEFQNIAGILPVMEKLDTLRLHLPRRYLLHQLFRSGPLYNITTVRFNFENAHPNTIRGVFNHCPNLEFLEISTEQLAYHLHRLVTLAQIELKTSNRPNPEPDIQVCKVLPKMPEK